MEGSGTVDVANVLSAIAVAPGVSHVHVLPVPPKDSGGADVVREPGMTRSSAVRTAQKCTVQQQVSIEAVAQSVISFEVGRQRRRSNRVKQDEGLAYRAEVTSQQAASD